MFTDSQALAANPSMLVCDTDALSQVLVAGDFSVIRDLKKTYHTQPVLVEAVEYELRSPQSLSLRRLVPKYEAALEKALGNGTLQVLDERSLPYYLGPAAHAVWNEISIRATKWARRVQRGEAYSHAVASTLSVPVLTHDITAIRILEKDGEALSQPLLRVFDLYALGFQTGCMSEAACDGCRQKLLQEGQFLPKAFQHHGFKDGLGMFYPRIQVEQMPPVGHAEPIDQHDFRLLLQSPQPVSPPD